MKFNLAPDAPIVRRAYIGCMADIRVLIVDDMERVRQDLHTFLTLAGGIEIVGEACNGLEAVHLTETICPQVILMDLEMPIMNGYEATRQIKAKHPKCRVIVLSIHAGAAEQQKAFEIGANAFLAKGAPLDVLLKTIRATHADNAAVEP